jgi:hypothetical protein
MTKIQTSGLYTGHQWETQTFRFIQTTNIQNQTFEINKDINIF